MKNMRIEPLEAASLHPALIRTYEALKGCTTVRQLSQELGQSIMLTWQQVRALVDQGAVRVVYQ